MQLAAAHGPHIKLEGTLKQHAPGTSIAQAQQKARAPETQKKRSTSLFVKAAAE
jgi:hypothetical protein